jgi:hypothetical protein
MKMRDQAQISHWPNFIRTWRVEIAAPPYGPLRTVADSLRHLYLFVMVNILYFHVTFREDSLLKTEPLCQSQLETH